MAKLTKEEMIAESKKILKGILEHPEGKEPLQIAVAVAYTDGTTQTMHVADMPIHAMLVTLQQTQLLASYKKEMKL